MRISPEVAIIDKPPSGTTRPLAVIQRIQRADQTDTAPIYSPQFAPLCSANRQTPTTPRLCQARTRTSTLLIHICHTFLRHWCVQSITREGWIACKFPDLCTPIAILAWLHTQRIRNGAAVHMVQIINNLKILALIARLGRRFKAQGTTRERWLLLRPATHLRTHTTHSRIAVPTASVGGHTRDDGDKTHLLTIDWQHGIDHPTDQQFRIAVPLITTKRRRA